MPNLTITDVSGAQPLYQLVSRTNGTLDLKELEGQGFSFEEKTVSGFTDDCSDETFTAVNADKSLPDFVIISAKDIAFITAIAALEKHLPNINTALSIIQGMKTPLAVSIRSQNPELQQTIVKTHLSSYQHVNYYVPSASTKALSFECKDCLYSNSHAGTYVYLAQLFRPPNSISATDSGNVPDMEEEEYEAFKHESASAPETETQTPFIAPRARAHTI
ncbi:MAG: hypothetical protein DHS20C10_10390 [marine bacterium B5-7]|nr:MAG: hypothetical protein DHS20C10_10390 [marine bacterium B5-7]